MHVDDFIDDPNSDPYASWFFNNHRLPAIFQYKWADMIKRDRLYCDYRGERLRVTGCSRMGDVWLNSNLNKETGYDIRADIAYCSNWGPEPCSE